MNTPLGDEGISALIDAELSGAMNGPGSESSTARARALDFYFARPFGNEVEGRSQIVTSDVMDTIESIMPSLMRVFTSGKYVEFDQTGPDDTTADIESEYVEHVFASENDGVTVLMDWFKDAMLSRTAYVKVDRTRDVRVSEQTLSDVPDDAFMLLMDQVGERIVAHTERVGTDAAGMAVTVHDVQILTVEQTDRTRVFTVPAKEIRYSGESPNLAENRFVAHVTTKQKHEVQSMGFTEETIEKMSRGGNYAAARIDEESMSRESTADFMSLGDSGDDYECVDAFIRVDADGDGFPELRRVVRIGGIVVANDVVDDINIVDARPIRFPHRHEGISIADLAMDLMFYKSVLLRNIFDNLYYINNQRVKVMEGRVNLDDLLTHRPAGMVRVKSMDALEPLAVTPFTSNAYGMVEYLDMIRENRTGITRYNQGLDASSLNKTATGVARIMQAGQERLDLIARVFAGSVARLFLVIHGIERKYQTSARTVRLSSGWKEIDPSGWQRRERASTRVGLGHINNETQIGYLMQILGLQQQANGSPLVDSKNIYATATRIIRTMGVGPPETFVNDPAANANWQPQPSFEEKKLQAEMQIRQYEIDRRAEVDLQIASMRYDIDSKRVDSKERVAGAKAAVDIMENSERGSSCGT